ncbi:hypothetical protein [Acinetobacter sp. V2]|uniref:hypothetical protein n=1 Tax=Acinetobacter sp. V2 TaxID=1051623 RepID=UPI00061E144B|nr:hypothetical protein [Acinetobacter sp. V2]KKC45283.1 hypothetical protein UC75_07290 [Acinetobacter sp. V2]
MAIITEEKIANLYRDIEDSGKAPNTDGMITPRYGVPFKSFPMVAREGQELFQQSVQQIIEAGLMEGFATEAELLASRPTVLKKYAKANDTKIVWFWNKPSGAPDGNYWISTGTSELSQANANTDLRERTSTYKNFFNIDEIVGYDLSRITNLAGRSAVTRIPPKGVKITVPGAAPGVTTDVRWRFSAAYFKDTNVISASFRLKSLNADVGAATQAVKFTIWQTNATFNSIKTDFVTVAGPEAVTAEKNVLIENISLDPSAVFVEIGFSIIALSTRNLVFEDFCLSQAPKGFFIRPLAIPRNLFPDPNYSGQYAEIFLGLARIENNELIMTFEETNALRQSLYQFPALGPFSPGAILRFGAEIFSSGTNATHMSMIFYDANNIEISRSNQDSRVANVYDILSSEYIVPQNCVRVDLRLMKDSNASIAKFKPAFLYSTFQNRPSFNPQFPLTMLFVDVVKGSDLNNGTSSAPVKTLKRAMLMGGYNTRVVVEGGDYNEAPQIGPRIGVLEVVAARNARVRLIGGTQVTGFTQTAGFSKVWQTNLAVSPLLDSDRSGFWLIHHGVPDETTLIPDNDRHSLHEGKKYRIADYTRIWKVDSVAEIESKTRPSWYWFEGVLYLSCAGFGNPNNADIRIPEKTLSPFYTSATTKDQKIKLVGIESFYWLNGFRTWDFSSVEMIRCKTWGNRVNGVEHSNTMSVSRECCESGGNWVDGTGAHVHTAQGRPNPSGQSCLYMGFNNYEHDTGDDGQSLHEYWRGVDYGGLIEHPGDRALATAVGGHSVHHDLEVRDAGQGVGLWPIDDGAGFSCVGTSTDGGITTNMELINCVAKRCRISINVAGVEVNKNVVNARNFKSFDPIYAHFNSSGGVLNLEDASFRGNAPLKLTDSGGLINISNTEKVPEN